MKNLLLSALVLLLATVTVQAQNVLELKPSQSMSIAGKGPGQDAAINPYADGESIAIVENLGENEFSIRIQKKGEILKMSTVPPGETKEVMLLKGYELYFDAEKRATAKVYFKKSSQ